jgi:hypothetical protein
MRSFLYEYFKYGRKKINIESYKINTPDINRLIFMNRTIYRSIYIMYIYILKIVFYWIRFK